MNTWDPDDRSRSGFAALHPAVQCLFFASVISVTLGMDPLLLALSGLAAAGLIIRQQGIRKFGASLRLFLPTGLLMMLLNPLVSHNGVTILWYFPDGAPLTMESIVFGAAAAGMMLTLFGWFSCLQRVLTSDRIIYLIGQAAPRTALLISMILRLTGSCRHQWKAINAARYGLAPPGGSAVHRLHSTVTMLSTLIGWLLEHSLDTADAMKSRGFGAARRRAYSPFRFRAQDGRVCLLVAGSDAALIGARLFHVLDHGYYPVFYSAPAAPLRAGAVLLFGLLVFLPLLIEGKEALRWQFLKSKI